jgi:hypothetical protein
MTEQANIPIITVSVPMWGKEILNIGENAAYEAARRGDFQTKEVGGLLKVVVRPSARQLVGEDETAIEQIVDLLRKAVAVRDAQRRAKRKVA